MVGPRADALVALAQQWPGSAGTSAVGTEVVIHVDVEVLADDDPDGRCHLEEGAPLAAETARRLACDAGLVTVLEREGETVDVGRRTRAIPPALRRALRARDSGCRFPGCTNTRFLDGHHLEHWAHGGETELTNLASLCRTHHRLVYEGGFTWTPWAAAACGCGGPTVASSTPARPVEARPPR